MRTAAPVLVAGLLLALGAGCMSDDESARESRRPAAMAETSTSFAGARLEIDELGTIGTMRSFSWGVGVDVVEQKVVDANGNEIIRQLPGATSSRGVTFTYGLPGRSADLLAALAQHKRFAIATLELLSSQGQAVATYEFTNVWISDMQHDVETNSGIGKVAMRYQGVRLSHGGEE